jgi:hypothetical protein
MGMSIVHRSVCQSRVQLSFQVAIATQAMDLAIPETASDSISHALIRDRPRLIWTARTNPTSRDGSGEGSRSQGGRELGPGVSHARRAVISASTASGVGARFEWLPWANSTPPSHAADDMAIKSAITIDCLAAKGRGWLSGTRRCCPLQVLSRRKAHVIGIGPGEEWRRTCRCPPPF